MNISIDRQVLCLTLLVMLGLCLTQCLQSSRHVGRNVSDLPALAAILAGGGSPETVQGKGDLTVVVFTDYQCASCRAGKLALDRAINRDGNIRLVYKDWPVLGNRSLRAAEVALAARSQGIYPQVHSRLMEARSFDEATLRSAVLGAGGDWGRLQAELTGNGHRISEQLAANQLDALALGLQGTPGYLIGSVLVEGAVTEAEFLRAFQQARASR